MYYGTGRWLYKDDSPGGGSNHNALYGVKLGQCLANLQDANPNTTCLDGVHNLSSANSSSDICKHVNDLNASWRVGGLEDKAGDYFEERSISDPTTSNFNIIFFTTTEPSEKLCDFGGRSRVWGLNCLSGTSFTLDGCGSDTKANPPNTALLLQLSGGNIENVELEDSFGDDGVTDWYTGIPPESGPTLVPPTGGLSGEIILWIER